MAGSAPVSGADQRRIAGFPGCRLRPTRTAGDIDGAHARPGRTQPSHPSRPPLGPLRRSRPAADGPLWPVRSAGPAVARRTRRGRGKRERVGPTRAGDQERLRRRTAEVTTNSGAHRGDGRIERSPRPGSVRGGRTRAPARAIQACGSVSSASVGSVSGDCQTVLKSASCPTRSTTCVHEVAALGVLAQLGVHAEHPADDLLDRVALGAAAVELVPMSATDGTTSGPTPSITNSACPSSRVIRAVMRSSTIRCAGVWTMSSTLERPSGLRTTSTSDRDGVAQPGGHLLRGAAGVDERSHLGQEVAPQPRYGGELGPVGHLVQAYPEPEVARRRLEPALYLDDVRRHEQQLPRVGREHLVLAEHLTRQIGQDRAGLHRRSVGRRRPRPMALASGCRWPAG